MRCSHLQNTEKYRHKFLSLNNTLNILKIAKVITEAHQQAFVVAGTGTHKIFFAL